MNGGNYLYLVFTKTRSENGKIKICDDRNCCEKKLLAKRLEPLFAYVNRRRL